MRLILQLVLASSICNHIRSETTTVKKLVVNSYTSIRYAMVNIYSVLENTLEEDHEVKYEVRLPKNAYITGFRMLVNEKNITAIIMQKEEASNVYEDAKESDLTAGMVTQQSSVSDRFDVNVFAVAVNIAGLSQVEFNLQYEEILQKRGGKYTQKIYIDADHAIPELEIKCEFREKQQFKGIFYQTPFDQKKLLLDEEEVSADGYYTRKVEWRPSETEEESTNIGLDRPFEVEYELNPPSDGGLVVYNDEGEFVHLFSTHCDELKIMMKQIVFVIDISGSMAGNPILQVRNSMKTILSELRLYDYFNIILFENNVYKWKPYFQQATPYNIEVAKAFISNRVIAKGATNINDALIEAIAQFDDSNSIIDEDNGRYGHIIVFLTDGSPTSGERDKRKIRKNLRANNFIEEKCCKSTISTIAFGKQADVDFLRNVAIEHDGTMTIITETEEDIDVELVQTYEGMENPYYQNLHFSYRIGRSVLPETNITQSNFLQYDCGNELVIGGWTQPGTKVSPIVEVDGLMEEVVFESVETVVAEVIDSDVISRLVAYQSIQKLLEEVETTTVERNKISARQRALDLALDFGFVTPLTSLVVTEYKRKKSKGPINPKSRLGNIMHKRKNSLTNNHYDYGAYDIASSLPNDQPPNSGNIVHNFITARLIYVVIGVVIYINIFSY